MTMFFAYVGFEYQRVFHLLMIILAIRKLVFMQDKYDSKIGLVSFKASLRIVWNFYLLFAKQFTLVISEAFSRVGVFKSFIKQALILSLFPFSLYANIQNIESIA